MLLQSMALFPTRLLNKQNAIETDQLGSMPLTSRIEVHANVPQSICHPAPPMRLQRALRGPGDDSQASAEKRDFTKEVSFCRGPGETGLGEVAGGAAVLAEGRRGLAGRKAALSGAALLPALCCRVIAAMLAVSSCAAPIS